MSINYAPVIFIICIIALIENVFSVWAQIRSFGFFLKGKLLKKIAPPGTIIYKTKARNENIPNFKELEDTIDFDFSTYDGNCSIGNNHYFFELHWQGLGEHFNCIRLYDHGYSIRSIDSLPDHITEFAQIKNQTINKKNRCIELKEKQVCLLENLHGYFAAIKIIKIIQHNITSVVFEYKILDDRSCDFSKHYKITRK